MTDLTLLIHPKIIDPETIHDFSDALTDRAREIERNIAALSKDPENKVIVADTFRALHNIKGDAALCSVPMAGLIAHPLESLLTRLRSGEMRYSPLFGEIILLTMDRLELAIEALMAGKPVDQLKLPELVTGLEQLSQATQNQFDLHAAQLIKIVTGFQPKISNTVLVSTTNTQNPPKRESMASDLRFFRSLALQFETRSPLFVGRTDRIHQLVTDTNRMAGSPVDEAQLEAASYMHDIGMMFLPESIWFKVGKMSSEERAALHTHVDLSAGLLERMENWGVAAEIVRQHHEAWDGSGYPAGMTGATICTGAKILAIVDAFEAVMLKHSTRGHSSSTLRAIAEINACDKQFAPEWIEPFNNVVRNMLER